MFAGVLVGLVAAIAQYPGERNDPDACRFDMARGGMTLAVGLGEIAVAPGETVPVRPSWTPYPSAFDPVPARCLNGWRVSDAKTARLAKDRIVDSSEVARRDPEVIFASWCGKRVRPDAIVGRPGWQRVTAVRHRRIHEIKSAVILQPGPAALTDGVRQIQAVLTHVHAASDIG